MASKKHVDLETLKNRNFVRSKCYPEDISKDKGKKASTRKFYRRALYFGCCSSPTSACGLGDDLKAKALAAHLGRELIYQKLDFTDMARLRI